MRVVGQISDWKVTRDKSQKMAYGLEGGPVGVVRGVVRQIVDVTIIADELDMSGPMNTDPQWLNVIMHPGTACSWTEARQGYVVNDRRGGVNVGDVAALERDRDRYRRAVDDLQAELDKVKKENTALRMTAGLKAERVVEAVKKGANARMLNLDVEGDDK